jgi:hypothetical protein
MPRIAYPSHIAVPPWIVCELASSTRLRAEWGLQAVTSLFCRGCVLLAAVEDGACISSGVSCFAITLKRRLGAANRWSDHSVEQPVTPHVLVYESCRCVQQCHAQKRIGNEVLPLGDAVLRRRVIRPELRDVQKTKYVDSSIISSQSTLVSVALAMLDARPS